MGGSIKKAVAGAMRPQQLYTMFAAYWDGVLVKVVHWRV